MTPRIARRRKSRKTSRPGWRRSSSPAPDAPSFRACEANRNLALNLWIPSTRKARVRMTLVVALRGKDIDAFLARPDAGRPIILLYGPDAGLVRERADALMASAVDDPNDPFSLVRLDGDELSAEPSRLVDEAMTVPLFGGRRAISRPRRLAQLCQRRRYACGIAVEGLPHRDRGRRAAGRNRRCARPASAPRRRSRSPAIRTPNAISRN